MTCRNFLFILSFLCFFSFSRSARNASAPCRFAPLFSPSALFTQPAVQENFLAAVIQWEANFLQGLQCSEDFQPPGLSPNSFVTLDGGRLDVFTGLPINNGSHRFSAPSKESTHVALIARALAGDLRALALLAPEAPDDSSGRSQLLSVLEGKITAFEEFQANYPGFGGFLPWFLVDSSGSIQPTEGFSHSIPALDNGQLVWAVYGLLQAMQNNTKEETAKLEASLFDRYSRLFDLWVSGLMPIFYAGGGHFRQNSIIVNPQQPGPATPENYENCPGSACFLEDPYEGEMFVVFAYLFGNFSGLGKSPSEIRQEIWEAKRPMMQRASLWLNSGEEIVTERGWVFSSHEKWKYLFLPYVDSPTNFRVARNGEVARTHFSAQAKIPGMFAAITGLGSNNWENLGYFNQEGISQLAFQKIPTANQMEITPYAAFPLFLFSPPHASVWYLNSISGVRGQNCFGSTEGANVTGWNISPIVTWDSKFTTILAWLGGLVDLVRERMKSDGVYEAFVSIVESEWSRVFPDDPLPGEELDFALPTSSIPQVGAPWPSCTEISYRCDC